MKRFSLLLFVLVLWSFGIAGHATHNFEQMSGALFGLAHWDCHAWDIAIGLVLIWVSRFGEKFFKN